jgi:hypothetical protein
MAMKTDSVTARVRQGKSVLIIAVFLVLICLPTLDWIFHLDHAAIPIEKRRLAELPKFKGVEQIRDFLAGLEQYFNDHFGFRKRLIWTNNHWKRQLFNDSPNSNVANTVARGRDGWLFYTSDRTLDDMLGASRFSQQDLENWRRLLERRRDWLAKRGGKYLFVIPPDKHSIYPEYLPDWIILSPKPGKAEQLVDYMNKHSTVQVLDLRKPLIEAKPLGVTYLKLDSHWNCLGGFIGYQAVIRALQAQIPGLTPLPLESFGREPMTTTGGNLSTVLGDSNANEPNAVLFVFPPSLKPLKLVPDPARLPKQWLKDTDPVVSHNDDAHGKAVVFRDSFAIPWMQFLGYHFQETIYIWQFNWDAAFLDREKPDLVIDEILEKFISREDPKELMRKDALP